MARKKRNFKDGYLSNRAKFGYLVHQAIKQSNLSMVEVAAKARIGIDLIYRIEKNKVDIELYTLIQLIDTLGISWLELANIFK